MSEDKMREEFEEWHLERLGGDPDKCPHKEWEWEAWKACAAIKDAEIATRDAVIAQYEKREQLWVDSEKEIAALDLMIKELREALQWYVDTDEVNGCAGNEFWLDGKKKAEQTLAKSEHHNSRALEKMLLEARIDELKQYRPWQFYVSDKIKTLEAKLAELNKE